MYSPSFICLLIFLNGTHRPCSFISFAFIAYTRYHFHFIFLPKCIIHLYYIHDDLGGDSPNVEYHLTVVAKFGILGHTLMLGTVEMLQSECLCVS